MVKHSKITKVFQLSLVIIFILVLLGLFVPQQFQNISFYLKNLLTTSVGWFYLLLVTGILIFCVFLIVSPIGQIRLGNPTSRPEHSTTSWIAMMFSAGMGIGLVFYGAAEPLSHFAISTPNAEIGSADALADAFRFTFFHWGFHAWAVYALVGLSLAYFGFRKREKYQLSVVFKPLFGKYADGPIATIIDTITIIATVIGVATTLGFGASQINGGLSYVFGIPNNSLVQVIIIIIATILFLISALSGLGKGVKILSNTNLILAVVLLAGVIVLGPTVKTIFYWAWWISWSPFVGVFIARISKGRTIREFLTVVLLAPTVLSFIWFSAFGTLSTSLQDSGVNLIRFATEEILFASFNEYPLGSVLSLLAIILVLTFFVTSADSATYVLAMLSEDGNLNPSNRKKVIWGVMLALIAIALMFSGGLTALQNTLIIVAFPFSIVLVLMMWSLMKELYHEKEQMGLAITPDRYPEKNQPFKSYEEN